MTSRETWIILGGRCFLPQAPRSYPIPMAHRVTPGHPEVTPGTKSYWHTSTTPSLVWQTKYVKCVRAIANHIFNTISFGDKTKLKVGNRQWHTRIDSKTAAFHPNEKSNQFCSTRPVFLSWLWTWIFRLFEQSEQSSAAWHTQVSWHFQHTNLDVIDVTFLWFLS